MLTHAVTQNLLVLEHFTCFLFYFYFNQAPEYFNLLFCSSIYLVRMSDIPLLNPRFSSRFLFFCLCYFLRSPSSWNEIYASGRMSTNDDYIFFFHSLIYLSLSFSLTTLFFSLSIG